MADFFHRLVAPAYFTGGPTFPSEAGTTYDYINNGGSGTPAFADGAKVGTVNAGTYFTAFAEDATSNNMNRPAKALAENCDHLDNLLHRSIAVSVRTNDVNPGAPVPSIVLPVGTFLGVAGYTTSAADLNRLFEITDDNDNEIIDQSLGLKIGVASVVLGAGDSIGGGGANGSFSGNTVTLTLNFSIPTGQIYRVYYGTRSNVATLPLDALTNITIRGAQEVEAGVETLLRDLHGNSLAWNDPWTSTIWDLAASGLHERYQRSTSAVPGAPPETYFPTDLNTSGAGAWYLRNGPAITGYATGISGGYADPINAVFAAKFRETLFSNSGGTTGFVVHGARLSGTAFTGEKFYQPGTAPFLYLWGHRHSNTIHGSNPYTRVLAGASVNLTTPNTNADTGEAVVELTDGAQYFRKTGTDESAISLGYDMLELEYTQTAVVKRRTVVVVAMGSSADLTNIQKVRIRNLDGTIPNFTGSSAATIIAWHSTLFAVGDGVPVVHSVTHGYSAKVKIDGLLFSTPPKLSSGAEDNVTRIPATFVAGDGGAVLQWGGFQYDQPSGPVIYSTLYGDGGIVCGNRVNTRRLRLISPGVLSTGANVAIPLDTDNFGRFVVVFTGTLGTSAITFGPGTPDSPLDGDEIEIIFIQSASGFNAVTWPAEAVFSGSDDQIAQPGDAVTVYRGIYVNHNAKWYFQKTAY